VLGGGLFSLAFRDFFPFCDHLSPPFLFILSSLFPLKLFFSMIRMPPPPPEIKFFFSQPYLSEESFLGSGRICSGFLVFLSLSDSLPQGFPFFLSTKLTLARRPHGVEVFFLKLRLFFPEVSLPLPYFCESLTILFSLFLESSPFFSLFQPSAVCLLLFFFSLDFFPRFWFPQFPL